MNKHTGEKIKVQSWFLENTDKTDKALYSKIHQDTKKENKNDQYQEWERRYKYSFYIREKYNKRYRNVGEMNRFLEKYNL